MQIVGRTASVSSRLYPIKFGTILEFIEVSGYRAPNRGSRCCISFIPLCFCVRGVMLIRSSRQNPHSCDSCRYCSTSRRMGAREGYRWYYRTNAGITRCGIITRTTQCIYKIIDDNGTCKNILYAGNSFTHRAAFSMRSPKPRIGHGDLSSVLRWAGEQSFSLLTAIQILTTIRYIGVALVGLCVAKFIPADDQVSAKRAPTHDLGCYRIIRHGIGLGIVNGHSIPVGPQP